MTTTLSQFVGTGVMAMNVGDVPAATLRAAITASGIPEKFLRAIQSSDAFKRAMRDMVKAGIVEQGSKGALREKVEDDDSIIAFQFTQKFLRDRGMIYDTDRAIRVEYSKERKEISCDNEEILKLANELFSDARETYPSSKINDLARSFAESRFTRLSYRDGVYFVPKGHEDVAESLRVFYKAVGAMFQQFPVGQMPDDKENLLSTIIGDMKQKIESLKGEMERLKHTKTEQPDGTVTEENKLTKKIAANRLKELKVQLERYRELARVVDAKNEELLKAAGEAGTVIEMAEYGPESLVAMALQGRTVAPIALELAAVATGTELPAQLFNRGMSMPAVSQKANKLPAMALGGQQMAMPQAK